MLKYIPKEGLTEMTQIISPDEYHRLVGHYMVAWQAQEEVRKQEKYISTIIKIPQLNESVSDAIYNPTFRGTKSELDEMLLKGGILVEWKPAQNKFAKQQSEKEDISVSG